MQPVTPLEHLQHVVSMLRAISAGPQAGVMAQEDIRKRFIEQRQEGMLKEEITARLDSFTTRQRELIPILHKGNETKVLAALDDFYADQLKLIDEVWDA